MRTKMAHQREPAALSSSAFRNGKQLGKLREAPVKLAPDLAHWNGGPRYLHRVLGPLLIQKPASQIVE
jgi:hypothetical protein